LVVDEPTDAEPDYLANIQAAYKAKGDGYEFTWAEKDLILYRTCLMIVQQPLDTNHLLLYLLTMIERPWNRMQTRAALRV